MLKIFYINFLSLRQFLCFMLCSVSNRVIGDNLVPRQSVHHPPDCVLIDGSQCSIFLLTEYRNENIVWPVIIFFLTCVLFLYGIFIIKNKTGQARVELTHQGFRTKIKSLGPFLKFKLSLARALSLIPRLT